MAVTWDEKTAAHLFQRAGFGATPQQIKAASKVGAVKALKSFLKFTKSSDKLNKDYESLEMLQVWWIDRMMKTKTPLLERMVLFWHNHFATGFAKIGEVEPMHRQNQTLRAGAVGKFRDLVQAMAKDPAMLRWLDNNTNTKKKPNLNFARELMELFTCGVLNKNGVANYTETDIAESARCFTGWTINDGEFFFNEGNHDFGTKLFRGQSGAFNGEDIINFLVVDPATARRIPQLLWSYFAYDISLTDPILDELAAVYLANDTAIVPVLEKIFTHDAFYSDTAYAAGVKEPAVFTVSALRALKAKLQPKVKDEDNNGQNFGYRFQDLGQSLFDPPTVFGWDFGLSWAGAAGLLERANFAQWIAGMRDKEDPVLFKPQLLLGAGFKKLSPPELATRLFEAMGVHSPAISSVNALATYLAASDGGTPGELEVDAEFIDKKIRGAIALILSSAEFQAA